MTEPTVAAGFPRTFLDFAVSRGAERQLLMERSQIRADDLTNQDNRVRLSQYIALMRAAIELCNEPALALLFGESVSMHEISVLGLMEGVGSAEEGLQMLNHYARLAIDGGSGETAHRFEFVREEGNVWWKFSSTLFVENPLLTEAALARSVCAARRQLKSSATTVPWPLPKAVRFTHEEPSYRAEYDRVFRLPLKFGSHMNAIMFDEELLAVRLQKKSSYLQGLLSDHAETLINRLDSLSSTRGRVESALIPILHTGEASIENIAAQLGISRQTLFRKLKAEGVTFERVLDELRHKVALHYLREKKSSVNEAAYQAGFSDPAAFSRAFKRWTGSSPRKFVSR